MSVVTVVASMQQRGIEAFFRRAMRPLDSAPLHRGYKHNND